MPDVRYVKPSGADEDWRTHPAAGIDIPHAWATIQFSLDQMALLPAGDKELRVVGAPAGGYWENVEMKGPTYSNITIRGWTDHGAVTIQNHMDYDWGAFCEGRPPIVGTGQQKSVFTIENVTGVVLCDLGIANVGGADIGAGVHATKSQVDLIGCCIHHNKATPHTGFGGGFAFDYCNPGRTTSKIERCVIFSNKAGKDGAGGWINRNTGSIKITKTEFQDNDAEENGGGLALTECGAAVEILEHCLFGGGGHKNSANNGGAINISSNVAIITIGNPGATADADKNKIQDNVATSAGGGIRIFMGLAGVVIGGTSITTNHAQAGTGKKTANGGGIAIQQFELLMRPSARIVQDFRLQLQQNVAIENNDADLYGGGVFATIGTIVEISDARVATTTVNNNQASRGGGIYASVASSVIATGGEIKGNKAVDIEGDGGGVWVSNGSLSLTGSALDDNQARGDGDGGGAYVETRKPLNVSEEDFVAALSQAPGLVGKVEIKGAGIGAGSVSGNTAGGDGGGLICDADQTKTFALDITVDGIAINRNKAHVGGGLYSIGSHQVTIDSSGFLDNAAEKAGGVYIQDPTGLSIVDNVTGFRGNKATVAAGLYVTGSVVDQASVSGNAFSGNTLTSGMKLGRDGVFDRCTFNPGSLTIDEIEKNNMPPGTSQPSFIKK